MTVADLDPMAVTPGVELQVLRQGEELPAADPLQQLPGKTKARAADAAAHIQPGTGAVQMRGVVQIPNAVAGADPVAVEILGVAEAAGGLIAVGEGLIDLAQIVRLQQIVRVKDHKHVVLAQTLGLFDALQQIVDGIALAHLLLVEALKDRSPVLSGDLGGLVGTVVGDHIDLDQLLGIVLGRDAAQQMADHVFLISGRHQQCIPVHFDFLMFPLLGDQRQEHVYDLIGI